jgi:hypothetical protein
MQCLRGKGLVLKVKKTWNIWTPLVLLSVLIMGFMASVNFKDVGASPGTTFAVEYKYNWPSTGPNFKVNVTIYEADYVYSWQVWMEFDPAVLSFTGITFGGFLTTQPEGSSTNVIPGSNYVLFSESTIGSYQGKNAAQALLATITFNVLAAGHSVIDIDGGTYLMTRYTYCFQVPQLVTKYPTTISGYMSTVIGDADCDGDVDSADLTVLADGYGKHEPEGDLNHSGNTEVIDLYTLGKHY